MKQIITKLPLGKFFLRDEDGATTVDWVVLTAAVVGLSIALFFILGNASHDQSELIGDVMSTRGIVTY